jgi:hypothetical protein
MGSNVRLSFPCGFSVDLNLEGRVALVGPLPGGEIKVQFVGAWLKRNVVEEISSPPMLKEQGVAGFGNERSGTSSGSSAIKIFDRTPRFAGAVHLGLSVIADHQANWQ